MRARPATLALLAALAASPALSQDAAGIEAVIRDQLSDFNARDVEGAWEHASPMIQGMFGTPRVFGSMVETGYPMVWTNERAEFLDLEERDGAWHQRVLVRDAEGRGWICDYAMVETEDGWRINGVQILPAPELSA